MTGGGGEARLGGTMKNDPRISTGREDGLEGGEDEIFGHGDARGLKKSYHLANPKKRTPLRNHGKGGENIERKKRMPRHRGKQFLFEKGPSFERNLQRRKGRSLRKDWEKSSGGKPSSVGEKGKGMPRQKEGKRELYLL